jgi:hypothetical protein
MSEDTLLGTNEAYTRLRRMTSQSNDGRISYPSGTNMRGSQGREHHAEGDMVGNDAREMHARGDRVGGVECAPGMGGSMMKPNFGAPQPGRDNAPRRGAVAQAHGENHKRGERVGEERREHHAMGNMVGQMPARKGPRNNVMRAPGAGAPTDVVPGAGGNTPRPMYRRGGRTEKMRYED